MNRKTGHRHHLFSICEPSLRANARARRSSEGRAAWEIRKVEVASSKVMGFAGEAAEQLNGLLLEYSSLKEQAPHGKYYAWDQQKTNSLLTRSISAIERYGGPQSVYAHQARKQFRDDNYAGANLGRIIGIVDALLQDVQRGSLLSVQEVVHADTFSSFIEMAAYLLEANYKDAAAVICGSTLEVHLRNLILATNAASASQIRSGARITANKLNQDLTAAEVYGKLDQKQVTAWLDIRNSAAHGKYSMYSQNQVGLMIEGVKDFLERYPA